MIKQIILEGGNVFHDAIDFDHSNIKNIISTVSKVLAPAGVKLYPIGSGKTPVPGKKSGDLDLLVDLDQLVDYFHVDPKAKNPALEVKKAVEQMYQQAGFDTKIIGINVHVRVPIQNGSAQVDIMVLHNAESVARFHEHDIPAQSPFKGVHKHVLLSSVAKETKTPDFPYGLMWSGFQGLFARDEKGKKGQLVSQNINEVAKILFGPSANAHTLNSVESMLAALPNGSADVKAQHAIADKSWPIPKESVQEGSIEWFSNLMKNVLTENKNKDELLHAYDSQTKKALIDMKAKYPNAPDELAALLKYITRISGHSNDEDHIHDMKLDDITKRLYNIEQRIDDIESQQNNPGEI